MMPGTITLEISEWRTLQERAGKAERERDVLTAELDELQARHQKLREAMSACVDGPRSPLGTHDISNGTVCNLCECQPHNCGCVAGVARRALAEDKEGDHG